MLLSLGLILIFGLIFGAIMKQLKLPSLLGMLLAGMLLGPLGLNWIVEDILVISKDLRQIALIIILTQAGLSLDLSDLKKVGRPAILMSFVPASFEIGAVMLLGPWLLKLSLLDSAILGSILAAVSPAVVVPRMLKLMERGLGQHHRIPQMIMAGASVDDVYVIVIFSALISLALGKGFSIVTILNIPLSIVLGCVLGFVSGMALIWIFKRFHMRDTIKVLVLLSASFFFVSLESALSKVVAISGLLAVMAMGITLLEGYPMLAKRLATKFSKSWVASELLLFVLVGAAVDFRSVSAAGFNVVVLILVALMIRVVGVNLCLIKTKLSLKERVFTSLAYLPKATVQAAIGSIPLSLGLSSGNILLSVAVMAILISAPLGAIAIDLTADRLLSEE